MLRKSDQALCAAVRDGHDAAFSAIVVRYRSQLLRHCRSLLRDGSAEDAVQQTFVRALGALRSGTEVRELGPWLHRIARNVALNELGTRERRHAELSEEWEDQGQANEFERRAELRAALGAVQALPERQRAALLSSIAGEAPAVIAQQLGLSNAALRQLLHRARVTVRAAVNALLPPPLMVWLSRRATSVSEKVPRAAGVPAGAAPLAAKVAVVVVASASVAAPVTVIHGLLTNHHHHKKPAGAHHLAVSHPVPAASSPQTPIVMIARRPSPAPEVQARPQHRAHHVAADEHRSRHVAHRSVAPPTHTSAPRAAPAPTQAPQQPAATGVSASSPNSAPVAASSAGPAAGPSAGATAASASGPQSSASASGPTMASGSSSGP